MNQLDLEVFRNLFGDVFLKCFGHAPDQPMSESDSKVMYHKIFDATGLTVGWKSLKNYSLFVLADVPDKQENPSAATLDTLARYVLEAPYMSETDRKEKEAHFPYWYAYKEKWVRKEKRPGQDEDQQKTRQEEGLREARGVQTKWRWSEKKIGWRKAGIVFILLGVVIVWLTLFYRSGARSFTTRFRNVSEDSLVNEGWRVGARDNAFWAKRGENPGGLTLYTLKGDNWPDPTQRAGINNLLFREIPCDCWSMEIHLKDFIPTQNWQQAGVLLMEDTGIGAKTMRVSVAYNDYNGGYPRSGTIVLQAITGSGGDKPEEIAHVVLFHTDSGAAIIRQGLAHSAFRIERQGKKYRILYSDGVNETTSFREIVSHTFDMAPRYAGLFAIRGFVDSAAAIPAQFRLFSINCQPCRVD